MDNAGKRTDQFVVRMPREEIDQLQGIAAAKGYSFSELVRMALRRVIQGAVRFAPRRTDADVQARPADVVEPAA